MSVRQYIGARYVPLFADPIQWDNDTAYEPLTVVMNEGTSYVSRKSVPAGIAISNTEYWIAWADYNAQIEAYRAEVAQYNGRISAIEGKFDANGDIKASAIADSTITSAMIADGAIATGDIADSAVTSAKIADGTIATGDIADSAVTSAKIADSAVTSAKIADGTIVNADIANGTIKKEKLAKDDIFLIFGDSWGNFADHPNWSTPVNDILGCGRIVNYASGGAGFTISGNSIATQIALANSELSATEKANVKYVIVMAGVNDHSPHAPSSFGTAFDTAMTSIKNTYTNALIQWFPTSCAPSYSTNGKWLFCNATFWWCVGRYSSGSESIDEPNRYCFPSCGTMFYFNSNSNIEAFFDSSKLHLNSFGLHAIVNAILDGFGFGNIVYAKSYHFARGIGTISIFFTPTMINVQGAFSNTGDTDLGNAIGSRILCVMAAQQASKIFNDETYPNSKIYTGIIGANNITYVNLEPAANYTKTTFALPGSYTSGTVYVAG